MDKGTVWRTVAFFITWINQILVFFGFEPFPYDGQQIYEVVSLLATIVVSIVTWFKNNFITRKGKKQKRVLKSHGLD